MTPMNKDQLQRWALIGEVAGALAVVVSLLFVAFQIKQGTEAAEQTGSAIQMEAYQSLIENIITINIHQMESAELTSVFLKIQDAPESLTPEEELHFMVYMLTLFRHGDTSFLHYQNGAIDEVRLQSLLPNNDEQARVDTQGERALGKTEIAIRLGLRHLCRRRPRIETRLPQIGRTSRWRMTGRELTD